MLTFKYYSERAVQPSVFFKVLKGCRGGALGCQHHFHFYAILLTHFHKHASFRPNMFPYLNTTFTFAKQTIDNFTNVKFQYRPAYSFIHFRAQFSFGRVAGAAAPGRPKIPHNQ